MVTLRSALWAMVPLAAVIVFVFLVSFLTRDIGTLGNLTVIGILIVVVPQFARHYLHYAAVRGYEQVFPTVVMDLAEAKRSGMSMSEAVNLVSKNNYGKLSRELRSFSNRLSWMPFANALDVFAGRMRDSAIITEALKIIRESTDSGGRVDLALASVARNLVLLREAEADRASTMREHVSVMYGVFFLFLGISIIIIYVMVPIIQSQPEGRAELLGFRFTNPCQGINLFPCNVYRLLGGFLGAKEGISLYYISMFFTIALLEAIFIGLVAGQLGESSVTAGGKHSLVMISATIGVFLFLVKAGVLPA